MDYIDQPIGVFVELFIGGFNLTPIPPQYLIEFRHKRNMADSANNFSFSVYDDTALELEYVITEGEKDVVFRYGYSNGKSSPVYGGTIWDYSLSFEHGGVVLNVEGTSQILNWHAKRATRSFKGMLIHEIVKRIAKEEGWQIGYIEECEPIINKHGSDNNATLKSFHQMNISSVKFIKEELAPYAISKRTGESGFMLWFEDTKKGPRIYFAPPNWKAQPKKSYLLDYNKSGRGAIINFTPEVNGSVLMQGGGTAEVSGMEGLSNDFYKASYSDSSNPKKPTTGSKSAIAFEKGRTIINMSSASVKEMEVRTANLWYKNASLVYPATCEIIGDPDLKPNQGIEIIIMTNKGKLHHTSGVYLITAIEDVIESGKYTSTLELMKNAVSAGSVRKYGENVYKTTPPKNNNNKGSKGSQKPKEEWVYYTVKKGDSLWKIAAMPQHYSNGAKYTEIVKLNPQIKNSNSIYPGMKLKIKKKK